MPSIAVTIGQLSLSPFNVRTDKRDIEATAAMERSLLAKGQLMPLVTHPSAGKRDHWGVLAGGRRYRSFRKLIDRGDLPPSHPIDIVIRDASPAELIDLSTTENLIRRDLREYEVAAAVLASHRKGRAPQQIADDLGQELGWVRRQLRLAQLDPNVFTAFQNDNLTLAQAAAFAATEDRALQLFAFSAIMAEPAERRTPDAIRRVLKIGDRELARLLAYVGEDAYRAAGGRFELDLFAGEAEQRGRVVDEALLRQLADDALGGYKDDLRRRAERADLRFVTQPPQGQYGNDNTLQVYPRERGDTIELPDGDVVARAWVGENGPAVDWWWASRSAKAQGARPAAAELRPRPAALDRQAGAAIGQQYDNARQVANAAIREETGSTADLVEILRSIRRALLRAGLVSEARAGREAAALDFMVWAQLHRARADGRSKEFGLASFVVERDPEAAREFVVATEADHFWRAALAELQAHPSLTEPDLAKAFRMYRVAPAALKRLGIAVVTGLALERSLKGEGYDLPAHDALAAEMHLNRPQEIRHWWTPSAELLAKLPRERLLEIADPFVERVRLGKLQLLKAKDLPVQVARLLSGATDLAKSMTTALAARHWVHPLLDFPPGRPAPKPTNDDAREPELAEAAE